MIRFQQVSLTRGVKPLLVLAELTLNPGEKVGLIGANGAGKSSLFSLLRDELHADQGNVDFPRAWRVSYVAQETPALERSAVDYVIDGDRHLRQIEHELEQLEHISMVRHTNATTASAQEEENEGQRIAELHAALADADGYTVRSRAEKLLDGLGFKAAQFTQPVASFSGGWRMRLNLAQALMCPSDLLLLDEPTNHLDLDAIIWLEDWLRRYAGTLIVISHDRDFLDGVVNVVVQVDQCKLKRYGGNYSSFERQRAAQMILAASMIEKQNRQRSHLQSFIDRFKAQATKARQAQSRIKALARLEEIAPLRDAADFNFEFREPLRAPNPLLTLEHVDAGYPGADGAIANIIVSDINFSLQAGQRIGLLGVNGAGKSTLIKTIAGEIKPVNGVMQVGKGLSIGYFAQHQLDMLRHDESPLAHLVRLAPDTREQELRNFLGSFMFDGNMATAPVGPLSGGEKSRLAMALIVWQRPNLLLLDEPTNHLDLETREGLTMALAQFEGTVLLVSHDRHLLRATADEFLIVADGQARPFDGDLDDYRDWLLQTKQAEKVALQTAAKTPVQTSATPPQAIPTTSTNKTAKKTPAVQDSRKSADQRQRIAAQRKPLDSAIRKLEQHMEQGQQRLSAVEALLGAADIYEDNRKTDLATLLAEQAALTQQLQQWEEEWLEQQQALEHLIATA